jgi:Sugar phosphate permease
MQAWRFVLVFGTVSLLADVVYEGARSITGPLLASLGASAVVVGAVTGAGEAAALMLRLVSGPLADRTRRFWAFTIAGYALTVVTVPLLGLTATLGVASVLVIAERVGKAVRSPAKDTLLSHATAVTGRGRGFAVHEALDQIGAVLGPLTVAAVLTLSGGDYTPALLILAAPGVAALALLVWLRARVPDPAAYERPAVAVPAPPAATGTGTPAGNGADAVWLPRQFWIYAGFTAVTTLGFTTFGVLSFHLVERGLLPAAGVPVLYAAAMGVDALAALGTGWLFDKVGPIAVAVLPLLAAAVPALAFTDTAALAIAGCLLWGAAVGVQESTLRATVADLVAPPRRATAYGIYAAVIGAATLAGATLTGLLYDYSIPVLITAVITVQVGALALLTSTRPGRSRRADRRPMTRPARTGRRSSVRSPRVQPFRRRGPAQRAGGPDGGGRRRRHGRAAPRRRPGPRPRRPRGQGRRQPLRHQRARRADRRRVRRDPQRLRRDSRQARPGRRRPAAHRRHAHHPHLRAGRAGQPVAGGTPARGLPSSAAVIVAVARRWSTSYVLGWRLRALHADQLLVDGESAGTEERRRCGRNSRTSRASGGSRCGRN